MSLIERLQFPGHARVPLILQNESQECGLACLAMVACYHGFNTDLASLHRRSFATARGARLSDLIQIASRLKITGRPVKADLHELDRLPLPSILHWDFNHYVVLTKVGARTVELHDPANGKRKLSLEEVSRHYTGVALELKPQGDFEHSDERRRISLFRLFGPVKGLGRTLGTIMMLALALEIFALVSPLFMQLAVDSAIVSNDRELLSLLAIGFLLLGLVQASISLLRGWVMMVISNQLNLQLLSHLFRHLVRLPMSWFERRHLGDVVSRFESMGAIQSTLTGSFLTAIIDGLMVVATLSMMLFYSGQLSLIVVVAALSYAIVRLVLYRPLRRAQEEEITRGARSQSHFLESARGIQSLKLFGRQLQRCSQYESLMVDQFNAGIRVQRLGLLYGFINGAVFTVENIIVVWVAGLLILNGEFSVGMLFAFLAYKQQFINRSTDLIEKGIEVKMLGLHTERVADIALSEAEADPENTGSIVRPEDTVIEIRNLTFRYSDNEEAVIDNFSETIRGGDSVALVGPSGCGKTTLAKLLLGLLQPDSGEIRINGRSLARINMQAYREGIGTVMQDDHLFAGSIIDNLTFFDDDPDFERVQQVCEMASIHKDIVAMPLQYHSMIGDMGSVLSGGQKQRLLLARALYKQPQILILDEATSHLDVASEKLVSDAISQLPMTRIIIAHRPETIESADRIINLHKGTERAPIRELPLPPSSEVPGCHA